MRKTLLAATIVALASTLSSCGTDTGVEPSPASSSAVGSADLTVLTRAGTGNFPSHATPAAAASKAEVTLTGTIDGFEDGRVETHVYEDGSSDRLHYVVIRVKIDESLKTSGLPFKSGYAYATRPRGIEAHGADGELLGGRSAEVPIADFEKALPIGTRVILIASRANLAPSAGDAVSNVNAGVPNGEVVLDFYNPQSLLVDAHDAGALAGWQDPNVTFGQALADLKRALSGR